MEKLIYGFYTRPPFWIGKQEEVRNTYSNKKNYQALVEKPCIIYSLNNSIKISVFKDGFIGFKFDDNLKGTLDETLTLIEYFNAFMFVIYNYINTKHQGKKCMLDPYVVLDNDIISVSESSAGAGYGDETSYNCKYFNERFAQEPYIQRVLYFNKTEFEDILNEFRSCLKFII